jgi:hypothetical protein
MNVEWRKAWYGWFAVVNGQRLTVRKYRLPTGKFSYVARINESARTSPAKPHATAPAAKREAEQMVR